MRIDLGQTPLSRDPLDMNSPEARAYSEPSPLGLPVEAIVARHVVRRALYVAPVIVAVAWVLRGGLGAASAAVGVAVVVANLLLAGVALSRAAAVSMKVYHAVALLGFFIRLGLIAGTIFLVAAVVDVDRPALGLAALLAYLVLLTWEAWAVTKGSRKELDWA